MQSRRVLIGALLLLAGLVACGGEDIEAEKPPLLGVLELPIAHRSGGTEPAGAARIEIAPGEIRVDGETVLTLENGKVPAAEQSGHSLPKLKAKLGGKSALAISTHAATPYATLARVLNTGLEAGARTFGFKVRKVGTTKDTGWLVLGNNHFTPTAEDGKFPLDQLANWDSFVTVWEDAITACQGTDRVDCGYRPMAKAQGGKLDMMLRVRGSGIAVRMRQTGVPSASAGSPSPSGSPHGGAPATPPPSEKKPKVEMLDGIKGAPQAAEELPPEPSTEHVFTLRSDHATLPDSPVSGIVKPLCSGMSCAVVIEAEGISMSGLVLSLIGAAFPDGTPEPKLAWVLPP